MTPSHRSPVARRIASSLANGIIIILAIAELAGAQPGDLLDPLPPDFDQVRALLPATASGTAGGAYCGPTASADHVKWLSDNGFPEVWTWSDLYADVTTGIFQIGLYMDTHPDNGTSPTDLRDGLQELLDDNYPGQFDVGYQGRGSEGAVADSLGRDFAWLALYMELENLCIARIGWYDLPEGSRCSGHYVAMTGYDDAAGTLWCRFRDPARDVDCDAAADYCVVRWETSYELLNLEADDGGIVATSASRYEYDRSGNACSNDETRTPVQDGFIHIGGARLYSRPATGSVILGYNMATSAPETYTAVTGSAITSLACHPNRPEIYQCHPTENTIYKVDRYTGALATVPMSAMLTEPRRLVFGADATLYVLQGNTSPGFSVLAIDPAGALIGAASGTALGAIAYHEKHARLYWWRGASNLVQAYTATMSPLGGPVMLPSGPTFVAPGYLAATPTGEVLFYNHNGSSAIYRFDTLLLAPLPPIVDPALVDPQDMVADHRGHLYVAQGVSGPVLEFDATGARVTASAAAGFAANTVLALARSVRRPIVELVAPGNLDVDAIDPLIAENDWCFDTTAVGEGVTLGNTAGATTDGQVSGCFGLGGVVHRNVWYVYTAGCDGTACVDLSGSAFDTRLVVYDVGDCMVALPVFGCDDDSGAGQTSLECFPVSAGVAYLLEVGGADEADAGALVMTITCTPAGAIALRRGDCNSDTLINIADAVFLLSLLFSSGAPAICPDSCDANDDGLLNIADAISVLTALFSSPAPPLPAPYPACGVDPTSDTLGCGAMSGCP